MIFENDKTYDILKYIALVVLPALASLILGVAKIWGLPYGLEISETIMVIDTFLGALVKVSSDQFREGVD
jgi:hypothetical protein